MALQKLRGRRWCCKTSKTPEDKGNRYVIVTCSPRPEILSTAICEGCDRGRLTLAWVCVDIRSHRLKVGPSTSKFRTCHAPKSNKTLTLGMRLGKPWHLLDFKSALSDEG